jgi:arginyl-tRNA--protein-N-Asp/Glu arginylyltransferase
VSCSIRHCPFFDSDHIFMRIVQPPQKEEISPCPYLPGRRKSYEFFFADKVDAAELSGLLGVGWRKFGRFYFRPKCPDCRCCIPLRVRVAEFSPSRGQRRVLRKNSGLRTSFGPLRATPRIFEIYREHSQERFSQEANIEEFLCNFYLPSCPSLQSEIHLGDQLLAAGYLDQGEDCLSSVYFSFDPGFSAMNLGTFSILKEIAFAASLGFSYYYLGYYVPGCPNMGYKDHFLPREHYDWERKVWRPVSEPPEGSGRVLSPQPSFPG